MGIELGHTHDLATRIEALESKIEGLATQDLLQNASIGAGGLTVEGAGGVTVTGGGSLTITGTGTLNVASGGLNSAGSISAGTTITAGGTIQSTGGDVDGLNVNATAGNVTATGLVSAGGSISAGTTLSAGGNLSVGGTTTSTGDIFTPNATPAVSGYTICYLNSDGRVSKGSSSARYKVSIQPVDPASLGDLFPPLQSYEMQGDPEHTAHLGYIAEHLAGHPEQARFVVWQYDGDQLAVDDKGAFIPESIDFIGLLLSQTSQLNQRLKRAGF
jgi:hypothetical protein